MDAGEGTPAQVVATYREIAVRFGLKGPDQGRTKAKRAGWPTEPQNHPADPVRVRVPAEVWEGTLAARERGISARLAKNEGGSHLNGQRRLSRPTHVGHEALPLGHEIPSLIRALEGALATLRERLEREEARADGAEARAEAMAAEAAALREKASHADGQVAALREGLRATEAARQVAEEGRREVAAQAAQEAARAALVERQVMEEAQQATEAAQAARRAAEEALMTWTAGGPLSRAWRALTRRPG